MQVCKLSKRMRGRVVLYPCGDYKFLRGFVRMSGVNCRSVTPRSSGRIAVNSVLALWKCELGSTQS